MGSRIARTEAEIARRREAKKYNDLLKKDIGQLKQEVHSLICDLDQKHREMSLALKDSLGESNKNRLESDLNRKFDAALESENRQEFMNNLQKEVASLLREFHRRHMEMTTSLHKELADYLDRIEANDDERIQTAVEEAHRRAEIARWIGVKTRQYLSEFTCWYKEITRAMLDNLALYLQDLDTFNKERAESIREYMNNIRQYLLNLLDLDFGAKKTTPRLK